MNINIRLNKNFTTQYNKLQEEYGTDIARINGFDDGQLSYTDFIDNFVDKQTVADASIDGNANAGTKDICSLEAEMSKPHSKLLAFNKIFYEMNKKYGFKTANEWLKNEWDGHFYLHDAASSTMKPYCFAYDIEKLVKEGLYFIDNFNLFHNFINFKLNLFVINLHLKDTHFYRNKKIREEKFSKNSIFSKKFPLFFYLFFLLPYFRLN